MQELLEPVGWRSLNVQDPRSGRIPHEVGTRGRPIGLLVNTFKISSPGKVVFDPPADACWYKYQVRTQAHTSPNLHLDRHGLFQVTILPERRRPDRESLPPKSLLRKIWAALEETERKGTTSLLGGVLGVFDGRAACYTSRAYPSGITSITNPIEIRIDQLKQWWLAQSAEQAHVLEALNALNVLWVHGLSSAFLAPANKSTTFIGGLEAFNMKLGAEHVPYDVGNGVELWRGVFQSIKLSGFGPRLNVDTTSGAFIKSGDLSEVICSYLGKRNRNEIAVDKLSQRDMIHVKRFLRNVCIDIFPPNHAAHKRGMKLRCGLSEKSARDSLFKHVDESGREETISVEAEDVKTVLKKNASTPSRVPKGGRVGAEVVERMSGLQVSSEEDVQPVPGPAEASEVLQEPTPENDLGNPEDEDRKPDLSYEESETRERASGAPEPRDIKPFVGSSAIQPSAIAGPSQATAAAVGLKVPTTSNSGNRGIVGSEQPRASGSRGAGAAPKATQDSSSGGQKSVDMEKHEGCARKNTLAKPGQGAKAPGHLGQGVAVAVAVAEARLDSESPEPESPLHEQANLGPRGGCRMCCGVTLHTEVGDFAEYGKAIPAWRVFRGVELPPALPNWFAGWPNINLGKKPFTGHTEHTLVVRIEDYQAGKHVRSRVKWRHYFSSQELNQRGALARASGIPQLSEVNLAQNMYAAEKTLLGGTGFAVTRGFVGPYDSADSWRAGHMGVWGARGQLGKAGFKRHEA
ncbi:hypothetical protein P7C70_g1237, partial [Phenoliferia sp. Uapishka_3]